MLSVSTFHPNNVIKPRSRVRVRFGLNSRLKGWFFWLCPRRKPYHSSSEPWESFPFIFVFKFTIFFCPPERPDLDVVHICSRSLRSDQKWQDVTSCVNPGLCFKRTTEFICENQRLKSDPGFKILFGSDDNRVSGDVGCCLFCSCSRKRPKK